MVICIVALVVFAFLGIFSAKYRSYAREAFGCVGRMVTLRPCDTQFDEKMRSKIAGKLMTRSPSLAKFTFKNFKTISWIFVVVFFVSLGYTGYTAYNLYRFGSCDPHSDNCIFNPGAVSCGSEHCADTGCTCDEGECGPEDNYSACEGDCQCDEGTCG